MNPSEAWIAIMGEPGAIVRSALQMLSMVDEAAFDAALQRLDRETAVGPLLDPSAYVDGRRLDNAAGYRRIIEAVRELRKVLKEEAGR